VYEPIPPTAERIGTVLHEGDRVKIRTVHGDVIKDTFVCMSGNELQCRSHTVALEHIKWLEHVPGSPRARVGTISAALITGGPSGVGLKLITGEHTALAGAVGSTAWLENWFHFHFDLLYHRRGFDPESTGGLLPHYLGIGAGSSQQPDGLVTLELRVPIGWELLSRVGAFAEVAPVLRVDGYDPGLHFRAGAGMRFWF
jgi:hypothetical protein